MHKVVSNQKWEEARKELLVREKALSHERESLRRARQEMPWVKVEKNYEFAGPEGIVPFADLFQDRSQLILYHFMLGPKMDMGCVGCSFMMDNLPADLRHLAQKDLRFVAVSRAPLEKIEAYRKRMGWNFPWYSSNATSFNQDFGVTFTPEQLAEQKARAKPLYNYGTIEVEGEEQPGLSVFFKDKKGEIYHTYSTFSRGLDEFLPTYHYLDITPKGRDETGAMSWVKRHDEYPLRG